MSDERLHKFLNCIPSARWRSGRVPPVWNDQLRMALSERYITIGFGGVLSLSDAGRAELASAQRDES